MIKKVLKAIYRIEDVLVVATIVAMVVVVVWSVLCRRVFGIPFLIGEELSRYLMIYGVFIGISIGVRKSSHVGIRVLVEVFPFKAKRTIDVVQLVITTVMYVVFGLTTFGMIRQFVTTGQVSTMLRLPMSIVYTILPVGFWLSAVHSIEEIMRYIRSNFLNAERREKEANG